MSYTFFILKPDAVARECHWRILDDLERDDLVVVHLERLTPTKPLVEEHYAAHAGRPYFDDLVEFMTSGPILGGIIRAEDAVDKLRDKMGSYNLAEAAPGTIRARYMIPGDPVYKNLIHGSDSDDAASHEAWVWLDDEAWERYFT